MRRHRAPLAFLAILLAAVCIAVHEFKDWRTAPVSPMPAWVDTGTAIVDKSNLAAFREAVAARPKPRL